MKLGLGSHIRGKLYEICAHSFRGGRDCLFPSAIESFSGSEDTSEDKDADVELAWPAKSDITVIIRHP